MKSAFSPVSTFAEQERRVNNVYDWWERKHEKSLVKGAEVLHGCTKIQLNKRVETISHNIFSA